MAFGVRAEKLASCRHGQGPVQSQVSLSSDRTVRVMNQTSNSERVPARCLLGILLLSCSLLMNEVLLTRIFSVMAAHHFSFMVVSIAMFGTGLASMRLFLRRDRYPLDRIGSQLSFYAQAYAWSVLISTGIMVNVPFKLEVSALSFGIIAMLYLVAGVPLYFGGFALSLSFNRWSRDMGRLYAFDLVGSALGCLLTLACLDWLNAGGSFLMAALLGLLSASLCQSSDPLLSARSRTFNRASIALVLILLALEPGLNLFEVHYLLGVRERGTMFLKWNSISRIVVVPGAGQRSILIDAGAATNLLDFQHHQITPAIENFQARASSLAFKLHPWNHVLVIGAGGGEDVLAARLGGARQVTGIEINPATVHYVRDLADDYSGQLYEQPGVKLVNDDARSFIQRSQDRYDLIQMSLIDTFAATGAGAFTLTENTLYTREAFQQYFKHLASDGILNISRWNNEVPRVLTIGCTCLRELGITDLSKHVVVLFGGGTIDYNPRLVTVLFKLSEFTPAEIQRLTDLARPVHAGVVYAWTGMRTPVLAQIIEARDLNALYPLSREDMTPTTDDRPFFFYTLKLSSLWPPSPRLLRDTLSPSNSGIYLLFCVMAVASILLVVLIAWPMRKLSAEVRDSSIRWRVGAYFASTGLGFMLLEVALLQKFSLFLGSPAFSLSVILATLLLTSGLGSATTSSIQPERARQGILATAVGLAVYLLLFIFGGQALLTAALPLSRALRVVLSVTLLAPMGLLLGRCLPLGILVFQPYSSTLMPWLWGVNTIFSVMGSMIAVVISMNFGFSANEWCALVLYLSLVFYAR